MSFSTDNYQIDFLDVKDADAILIRCYNGYIPYVILIDAGNLNDSEIIKTKLKNSYKSTTIDLAICTHPDKDHIGGFFDLVEDEEIIIKEFWLIDPAKYLNEDQIKRYRNRDSAIDAVRQVFNKPNDPSVNLIDKLIEKQIKTFSVKAGASHENIPINVLAPTSDYYGEIVKAMVQDYGVQTYEEVDTELYDEYAIPEESDAKSVIDEDDDPSPFNASSLVLLFEPGDGKKYLFTGDANCASLSNMIQNYRQKLQNITILKVPHHGSKHNLTTQIIDSLRPTLSIISAKGTKKHPHSSIVNWLSKYGNVYSTHKSGSLYYPKSQNESGAVPLKKKQSS